MVHVDSNLRLKKSRSVFVSAAEMQSLYNYIESVVNSSSYTSVLPADWRMNQVSTQSIRAIFLCHILFHSVRPDNYLQGLPEPAESMHTGATDFVAMMKGSTHMDGSMHFQAFRREVKNVAAGMVFPDHVWDARCYAPCFMATVTHIRAHLSDATGGWSLSAPWGHWQNDPTYIRYLKMDPMGVVGDVLGVLWSQGYSVGLY